MRHGVPGHGSRFTLIENVVGLRPVDVAGLGFHDPEVFALKATGQVVTGAGHQVIVMTCPDVPVPGGEIQVTGQRVMVKSAEPAHEIVRNPGGGGELRAERIHLQFLEILIGAGDKAFEGQHQAGVVRPNRQRNLRPVVIGLAPVGGRPMRIERLERAIFGL